MTQETQDGTATGPEGIFARARSSSFLLLIFLLTKKATATQRSIPPTMRTTVIDTCHGRKMPLQLKTTRGTAHPTALLWSFMLFCGKVISGARVSVAEKNGLTLIVVDEGCHKSCASRSCPPSRPKSDSHISAAINTGREVFVKFNAVPGAAGVIGGEPGKVLSRRWASHGIQQKKIIVQASLNQNAQEGSIIQGGLGLDTICGGE